MGTGVSGLGHVYFQENADQIRFWYQERAQVVASKQELYSAVNRLPSAIGFCLWGGGSEMEYLGKRPGRSLPKMFPSKEECYQWIDRVARKRIQKRSPSSLTKIFVTALLGQQLLNGLPSVTGSTVYQTSTDEIGHPFSTVLTGGNSTVLFSEGTGPFSISGAMYHSASQLPVTPISYATSNYPLITKPAGCALDNGDFAYASIQRNSVGNREIYVGVVDANGKTKVGQRKVFSSNYIAKIDIVKVPNGFMIVVYVQDANRAQAFIYKNDGTSVGHYITVTSTSGHDLTGPIRLFPFRQNTYFIAYMRQGSRTNQTPNRLYGQEIDHLGNRIGSEMDLGVFPLLEQTTFSMAVHNNALALAWIDDSTGTKKAWSRLYDLTGKVTHPNVALSDAEEGLIITPFSPGFAIGFEWQQGVHALVVDTDGDVVHPRFQINGGSSGTHKYLNLTPELKSLYATWKTKGNGSIQAINSLDIPMTTDTSTPIPTLTTTLSPTSVPTTIPTLATTLSPTSVPTTTPTDEPTPGPTPLPTPVPHDTVRTGSDSLDPFNWVPIIIATAFYCVCSVCLALFFWTGRRRKSEEPEKVDEHSLLLAKGGENLLAKVGENQIQSFPTFLQSVESPPLEGAKEAIAKTTHEEEPNGSEDEDSECERQPFQISHGTMEVFVKDPPTNSALVEMFNPPPIPRGNTIAADAPSSDDDVDTIYGTQTMELDDINTSST